MFSAGKELRAAEPLFIPYRAQSLDRGCILRIRSEHVQILDLRLVIVAGIEIAISPAQKTGLLRFGRTADAKTTTRMRRESAGRMRFSVCIQLITTNAAEFAEKSGQAAEERELQWRWAEKRRKAEANIFCTSMLRRMVPRTRSPSSYLSFSGGNSKFFDQLVERRAADSQID